MICSNCKKEMKTLRVQVKLSHGDYTNIQKSFLCECGHESYSSQFFPFNPSHRYSKHHLKMEEFEL